MEVTFANAFGKPGEMPSANGAQRKSYLLFKVFFALSKVYHALSKVFWVRIKGHQLLPLYQRDRETSLCGIFWTLRGPTASRHLGLPRPSRRVCVLPRRARLLPPFSPPHYGCVSSATLCGTWASTTRLLYYKEPKNNCSRWMSRREPA